MNRTKWLTLFGLLVIAALILTACPQPTPEVVKETVVVTKEVEKVVTKEVEKPVQPDQLDKWMAKGTLVVSTDPNYPPQSFLNEQGELDGFDVEVAKEVARRLGLELEFVTPDWDLITAGNWGGRWDISIGSMTITRERAERLYFTAPYYFTPAQFAVHKDSKATTYADLNGKRIGLGVATTYEAYLRGTLTLVGERILVPPPENVEIVTYPTDANAVEDLRLGDGVRLDAILTSLTVVENAIKEGVPIKKLGEPVFYEDLAFALDKSAGPADKALARLNQVVAEMHADGTLSSLSMKWFGVDLTKKVAPKAMVAAEEVLVIGTTDSWSSFEISWVYSFHDWELFHQCADGLLNNVPGTAGEVAPALAESYTVSEDGRVYTFKLREGVVFPNGDPLTADAVVWSLNRVFKIQEIAGDNANFLVTAYVDKIEKLDDMTVRVTFKEPYAFAPQLVATNPWKIINPNQWTDTEPNTTNTACGIGPYVLTSFTEGEEAIFEANPTYYGEPPRVKKVIVRYFADSPTMALALKNGEIDIAWKSLAPADLAALEGEPGIVVQQAPSTEIRYIVYNTRIKPFDDSKVRLGLAMLLDREQLTDLGWQGIKVPLYSMVPPGFLGHKPTYEGTENVEEGKRLLAEAGFTEDNPLVLDLWYSPTHYGDTEADVAAVIKQQWEASGVVKVNLNFLEWAAYRDAQRNGELPVSLLGWYPDYLDPDNYTNVFAHSPASWSGSFYSNPEMDALLEAQAAERDEAKRIALLEQIQDLWVKESPFVPLAQGSLYIAYRDNISNVVLDPLGLFHYFLVEKR